MFVDAHMHVNFRGFSADALVKYLDESRIDLCWLLTWEEIDPGRWHYEHLSIDDVWDAYSRYPSRIIPMYAPDPAKDDAAAELESWFRRGIRGCGELKSTLDWESPRVRSLLSAASRVGIPVVFHMEEARQSFAPRSSTLFDRLVCAGLRSTRLRNAGPRRCLEILTRASFLSGRIERVSFPGYMLRFASLEEALADFPGVNFVAHGPMFWKHISADAAGIKEMYPKGPVVGEGIIWRLLREHKNLHADISGRSGFNAIRRDLDKARRFLSLYEDKLLYGTDNCLEGQRDLLDSLGLSQGTYSRIYGGNACRLAGS